MSVFLIRHGQSEFNAIYNQGDPDPMIFDAYLTPLGIEQAKAARQVVAGLGIRSVVVSPLTRTIQTALHIFGDSLPLKVMAGARELLTHCCDVGRPSKELSAEFPQLSFSHLKEVWWHQGPVNDIGISVEPQDVFQDRVKIFGKDLRAIPQRPVAVVAHANLLRELSGPGPEFANCEVREFLL